MPYGVSQPLVYGFTFTEFQIYVALHNKRLQLKRVLHQEKLSQYWLSFFFYNLIIIYELVNIHDFINNYNFILISKLIRCYHLIRNYNFKFSRELIKCPSLLKCDEDVSFANTLMIYKLVSKKAGSVKNFQCLNVSEFLKI